MTNEEYEKISHDVQEKIVERYGPAMTEALIMELANQVDYITLAKLLSVCLACTTTIVLDLSGYSPDNAHSYLQYVTDKINNEINSNKDDDIPESFKGFLDNLLGGNDAA